MSKDNYHVSPASNQSGMAQSSNDSGGLFQQDSSGILARRASLITNYRHERLLKWSTKVITFLNNLTMEQKVGKVTQKAAMPHSAFARPTALAFIFRRKYGFVGVSMQTDIGFITKKIVNEATGEISWSAPFFIKGRGFGVGLTVGKLQSGLCLALMNEPALDHSLQKEIKFGAQVQFLVDMDGAYLRSVRLDSTGMADNVIEDGHGGLIAKYFRMEAMLVDFSLEWTRSKPNKFLNSLIYGEECTCEEILGGSIPPPTEFSGVIDLLNRLSESGRRKPKKKEKPSPFV